LYGGKIVSILSAKQAQGQGGLNRIDFFDFFERDDALAKAIQSFKDIILHELFI